MSIESGSEKRFHAFDAMRGCALLLGIVYHAAGSFAPFAIDTPALDRSRNIGFGFFIFVCHIFRMPLFFLIAGFFAHLVYQRKGAWGFLKHRFTRIGIPLLLFWFLLLPPVIHAWYWGMLRAEDLHIGLNSFNMTLDAFLGMLLHPRTIQIIHLWFLYYLLIYYAIVVAADKFIQCMLDRNGEKRLLVDIIFGWMLHRWWHVLILALPAAAIFRHASMMGLAHGNLIPNDSAIAMYFICFVTGWLLHRQAGLIEVFKQRWEFKLAFALALTVPLAILLMKYGRYEQCQMLRPEPSLNITALASRLREQLHTPGANPGKRIWQLLPKSQQMMLADGPVDSPEAQGMVVATLNNILMRGDFYRTEDFKRVSLASKTLALLKKDPSQRSPVEVIALNRQLLEAAYPTVIPRVEPPPPEFTRVKRVHGFLYALAMWLFVFGLIGLFLTYFDHESAAWRYITDASYWLYLIHLPIVYNLQVAMAGLAWHWSIKFPLLVAVAFAIMLPSYHFLVRPTAIGVLLNGRRYPPGEKRDGRMVVARPESPPGESEDERLQPSPELLYRK